MSGKGEGILGYIPAFLYACGFEVSDARVMVRLMVLRFDSFTEKWSPFLPKGKMILKYPIISFVNSRIFAHLTAPMFSYRSLVVSVPFLCRMACRMYWQLKWLAPLLLPEHWAQGFSAAPLISVVGQFNLGRSSAVRIL